GNRIAVKPMRLNLRALLCASTGRARRSPRSGGPLYAPVPDVRGLVPRTAAGPPSEWPPSPEPRGRSGVPAWSPTGRRRTDRLREGLRAHDRGRHRRAGERLTDDVL